MYKKKESKHMWTILDGNGHYSNGIKEIDRGINAYISYNTFGPECRGFLTLQRAMTVIDQLRSQSNYNGFSNTFSLDYLSVDELIQEHKNFIGENMILEYRNIIKHKNII